MTSIKNFFKKHIYFFGFFAFIIVYNFIAVGFNPVASDNFAYSFYLVDFSMGFSSKILPGAIYNFLFDDTSTEAVSLFSFILFGVIIAVISFAIDRLMNKIKDTDKKTMLFILSFFVTGTLTFSLFAHVPTSHDLYWLFAFALSLICLSSKALYPFIILLSLLGVTVNYGYAVSYLPFIGLLMVYKASTATSKKENIYLWIVTVITAVSSLALGIYFLIFECSNMKYTAEEFTKILQSRGYTGNNEYFLATLYNLDGFGVFNESFNEALINSTDSPLHSAFVTFYHRILIAFSNMDYLDGTIAFFISLPIVIMIASYLFKKYKNEKKITTKASLFLIAPMFFLVILMSLFMSSDIVRFIGNSFTALFSSFLFLTYHENGEDIKYIKEKINKFPKFFIAFFAVIYYFIIISPIG